jgi:DNA-binding HxlR family transcriptional regulator
MVESIIGCKWSLHVLDLVKRGIARPGAMSRAVRGLTTKVLNERLAKMCRFGILERVAYPEVPPRVEYRFTDFGRRFLTILDRVEEVQRDLDGRSR